MSNYNEKAFETAIVAFLTENAGYKEGKSTDISKDLAFDKNSILEFLKISQPKLWEKSVSIHGTDAENKVIQRLYKELDFRGSLDILRNGFVDYGVRYKMCYFKPVSGLNEELQKLYEKNILTVTRQVFYSKDNNKSIDLVIIINGIPIATLELKNQFTGQDVSNAKRQYMNDRDPRELIFQFKKRTLIHFAVDTDNVFMTTRLAGKETRYLPFNKGLERGAGNPPNPNGYRTSYLWEEILQRDSLIDIIRRYIHLEKKDFTVDGKKQTKENIIFPRYHQIDVVRKLVAHAKEAGAGKNYLIQHSAGSGKSNSIAWLSYQLASLHDANDTIVYHSVIVVTDRRVLDQQLQDTIYQFEHTEGIVEKIDKNSDQLADAIEIGKRIIITTLQKFPFIIDKIDLLPDRRYAIIVDEAHSSQGGEASKKMKELLGVKDLEQAAKDDNDEKEQETIEDQIRKSMEARGIKKNLSYFGFTATPKAKTLEVFGERDTEGKPCPFHLYSMRQAIEEGFILDVLKNYTTYKTFYKLSKTIEDDPQLNKKKAGRALANFVSLHPHNLAQKTQVIIEHFHNVTMKKIGGKAKAMVVTASRPHVIRYKQEFDKYLTEHNYKDIKALVAFTAFTDRDTNIKYQEFDINGFKEGELPEKFNTPEYQLLLVADKYQTGFDQPLLHTMYVDKPLSGVKAVQTLSRLNRTYAGKEDTFILDFVNKEEDIINSFQPYYEVTKLEGETDPNHLYDLKNKLEEFNIFLQSEIDAFCNVFFRDSKIKSTFDNQRLNAYIDPAIERYKALQTEEEKDEFKSSLISFLRLYAFLSQIMPFTDAELEKFYAYGRLLSNKLPKRNISEILKLDDEVALQYYRLQKMNETDLVLEKGKDGELNALTEAGIKRSKDLKEQLSKIIEILNEIFKTDFTDADQLFFDQWEEELASDELLKTQAKANAKENFKYGFDDKFLTTLIARMDKNEDLFKRIMDNREFRDIVKDYLLNKLYDRFKDEKE